MNRCWGWLAGALLGAALLAPIGAQGANGKFPVGNRLREAFLAGRVAHTPSAAVAWDEHQARRREQVARGLELRQQTIAAELAQQAAPGHRRPRRR